MQKYKLGTLHPFIDQIKLKHATVSMSKIKPDTESSEKLLESIHVVWNAFKKRWTTNGRIKFIITALGIFGSFFVVGILQETIMRGCYGDDTSDNCENGERFKYAITLVLVKCFCGLVFVQVLNLIKPEKQKDTTQFYYYASAGMASSLTMVSAYMALRYVTYPMQVICKSAKPLSVMMLGLMFCKRYKVQRYFFVLVIVAGVVVFKLFEEKEEENAKKGSRDEVTNVEQMYGTGLLILSLAMDGVLAVIQDKIRAANSPTFRHFMFGLSLWCCTFLLVAALVTLEILDVFAFIGRHPSVLWHLGVLGLADAIGNVFIYTMISSFASLACSITTTVRKFFSVIFSIIFFGNTSTPLQWLGAGMVFSGLFADAIFGKRKKKEKVAKEATNDDCEKGETKTEHTEQCETKSKHLDESETNCKNVETVNNETPNDTIVQNSL